MFSQDDDGQQGLVLTVVFGLVALVIALVIGVATRAAGQAGAMPPSEKPVLAVMPVMPVMPAPVAAPAVDAASAAQALSDAASIKVEYGVVKFYFASGRSELAAGASDALADVVRGAMAGRKLVVSGFHDATGDAAKNEALARQRALEVRNALKAAGVPEQQIELKKPEQLAGSGSNAEARRVEVALQ
ncbi:MAG: OmpA family protein [Pseudomonadota bacterium]